MFLIIFQGLGWTIVITLLSFSLGAMLGVIIAAGRLSRFTLIRTLSRAWVELIRSIPPLVWLFIVYFGIAELGPKLSPFQSAIVTFSVIASVYLGEIYRGGFASLPSGQLEAANSVGLRRFDILFRIIVPQVFRIVSPSMVTYVIGLMKDSALASTIGVVEMTFRANQITQTTGKGLTAFAIVGLIYLFISLPLGAWARRVDQQVREKYVVS
jgi:polar amino acid transport system permease protein